MSGLAREDDASLTPQAAARLTAELKDEILASHQRGHLDVRGLLAIMAVTGAFALAGVGLWLKGTGDVPSWASGLVAAVVTYYFIARSNGK